MIVLIDGMPASGKGIIRGILDNHSDVFSNPFHDLLPLAFCTPDLDPKPMELKDTEWLRDRFSRYARYYRIERIANQKFFPLDIGGGKFQNFDVNLDFYEFDRILVQKLADQVWTPEFIIESAYKILGSQLSKANTPGKDIQATLGDGDIGSPSRFLNRFPRAKLIYVRRDVKGIVAALCKRPPQPGNYRTVENEHDKIFKDRVSSGIVHNSLNKAKEIERLKAVYPDRVLIVNFDDIFNNFEEVKASIEAFLDISPDESINEFSFNAQSMPHYEGRDYLSKPVDCPEDILSKKEIEVIDFLTKPELMKVMRIIMNKKMIVLICRSYLIRFMRTVKDFLKSKIIKF